MPTVPASCEVYTLNPDFLIFYLLEATILNDYFCAPNTDVPCKLSKITISYVVYILSILSFFFNLEGVQVTLQDNTVRIIWDTIGALTDKKCLSWIGLWASLRGILLIDCGRIRFVESSVIP